MKKFLLFVTVLGISMFLDYLSTVQAGVDGGLSVRERRAEIVELDEPRNINSKEFVYYPVLRVVDGDTIDVDMDGEKKRLRLIGLNTPETVDPRKPVECFGIEASNRAKRLLKGQKVALEADSSQANKDRYGRLLRYVIMRDGSNYNLETIRDGYGYEYTYRKPYKYQKDFKQAEKYARENELGLWGAKCGD